MDKEELYALTALFLFFIALFLAAFSPEIRTQSETCLHREYNLAMKIQERPSVLAAPRMVRSTFLFARLRSAAVGD